MGIDINAEIRNRLLAWFSKKGRAFVWRNDPTPFTVLIAELLLKRTRAAVVNRFICKFLSRFPEASALATVDLQELATFLRPLGLSAQRAYQLKSLGVALTGLETLPDNKDGLLALPGVGQYTAAAVLCFAYGRAEALVDTNVARIILRVHGIVRPSRYEARRSPEVWERARDLIGKNDTSARSINWALLDLGATICKTRNPECTVCPLRVLCSYS